MQVSLEEKQHFLRTQILESGVDPQSFMAFMGTVKQQGQNINLENWTIQQLKQVVQSFKKVLQQQINRVKKQANSFRGSKQLVTSRIMESIKKKQKVYYDRDDLWDYQIHTQQQCRKTNKLFQFKTDPQIDYKAWQIKKSGGFLFGIGAKNQLQITFITNFTQDVVIRKSQDVDWLRQTLCAKYPGSYIPPLEQTRFIQPEDKVGIMRRIKQIILFLNSIVNFEHLVQNIYFYNFISQRDSKIFNNFKSKQTATRTTVDISSIQNLQGKFSVQISKRVLDFIKETSQFAKIADQIYISLETNMRKILGDLQTLTKHSFYVANDFAKFNDKFNRMSQKCKLSNSQTGQKMGSIFAFLNNMFTNIGNQYKKQMTFLKDITDDFLKYTHSEWSQFLLHEKKFNNQMNSYLTLKHNLLKKKQRNFSDITKWQIDQKQQFRMSRVNMNKMDRQDAFEMMFPKDNKIQYQTRIWQAYINDMYEKTFKILINQQQKQYLRHFGRLCIKFQKLSTDQKEMYHKFKQIFGVSFRSQAKQMQNRQ